MNDNKNIYVFFSFFLYLTNSDIDTILGEEQNLSNVPNIPNIGKDATPNKASNVLRDAHNNLNYIFSDDIDSIL